MKKLLFTIFTISTILIVNAQETKHKVNELKIDAFDAIVLTTLDVSYERTLNNDMGLGVSFLANFKKENGYYESFAITPFYRFYFMNNEDFGTKGYFVEAFSKFAFGDEDIFDSNNEEKKYFDIALGIGFGRKWIHNNNFLFETNFGIGRNLGLSENSPDITIRGGFSLGFGF